MSKFTCTGLQCWSVVAVVAALVACGSDSTSSTGSGGSTGGSGGSAGSGSGNSSGAAGSGASGGKGGGSSGGGGGPSCSGITGSYAMTRTRSKTNPGSCAPDYTFSASIPGKVTADGSEASGYRFEIGYSDPEGNVVFHECTNNVAQCSVFATCENGTVTETASITDQVNLKIDGNTITGTIARSLLDTKCTVNFDLTGTRK